MNLPTSSSASIPRRHFLRRAATLAVLAVAPTVAATQARADSPRRDGEPGGRAVVAALPATLGGMRRTDTRTNEAAVYVTYEAPYARAEIVGSIALHPVPDGATSPEIREALRQVSDNDLAAAARARARLTLRQGPLVLRSGPQGREWTWLGNCYDLTLSDGTTGRRFQFVTGYRNQVVIASLRWQDAPVDISFNPLMDELSAILAGTAGGFNATALPGPK